MAPNLIHHIGGTRAGEISASVEAAIRTGELGPGESLPSVRRLAEHLGVSPTTAAAAYRDLQIRGLVTAAGRRGTRVSPRPAVGHLSPASVPPGTRGVLDGNPDPAFLPDLGAALARLRPAAPRLYGEPANLRELLDLGAELFTADAIPADFLLVVGGALDGIERALGTHVRAGDRVAVEDPGYPPVFDLLLALGLVPVPLPVDDRGILPDDLEAAARGPLAALVLTPRAQNPTGAALDEQRARELREVLAKRPDVLVIEDDHGGPVSGTPAFSVGGDEIDRWAVVRSFSKSLGPDLRLGLMTGDPVTISRVEGRQQLGVGWVSHVLQRLVVALWHDRQVQRLMSAAAAAYTARRQALLDALAAHGVRARGRSGLNVWVPVADEQVAVRRLLDAGWAASPGERFRLRSEPAVRLSIGRLPVEEAPAVAAALAAPSPRPVRTRTG